VWRAARQHREAHVLSFVLEILLFLQTKKRGLLLATLEFIDKRELILEKE